MIISYRVGCDKSGTIDDMVFERVGQKEALSEVETSIRSMEERLGDVKTQKRLLEREFQRVEKQRKGLEKFADHFNTSLLKVCRICRMLDGLVT